MSTGTYIQFIEGTPKPKTNTWEVVTRRGRAVIGEIFWYSPWRKYCFFPQPNTVYEWTCLREIAIFCQDETTLHNKIRKARSA